MVQATLVEPSLSLEARNAGRDLLARLDDKEAAIIAAFWEWEEEREAWRLYLATPVADTKGPLEIYHLLQTMLKEMPEAKNGALELTDISVISPRFNIVRELRQRFGTVIDEPARRIRWSGQPYIYRLTKA